MQLADAQDRSDPDGHFDLCYAILNKEEAKIIRVDTIGLIGTAVTMRYPFTGLLTGFVASKNTERKLRKRGSMEPIIFELSCSPVLPHSNPPYVKPAYDGRFTAQLPLKKVRQWNWESEQYETMNAARPRGVSGGPLLFGYFEDANANSMESLQQFCRIVGIFIEHKNKTGVFVMIDAITDMIRRKHGLHLLDRMYYMRLSSTKN